MLPTAAHLASSSPFSPFFPFYTQTHTHRFTHLVHGIRVEVASPNSLKCLFVVVKYVMTCRLRLFRVMKEVDALEHLIPRR